MQSNAQCLLLAIRLKYLHMFRSVKCQFHAIRLFSFQYLFQALDWNICWVVCLMFLVPWEWAQVEGDDGSGQHVHVLLVQLVRVHCLLYLQYICAVLSKTIIFLFSVFFPRSILYFTYYCPVTSCIQRIHSSKGKGRRCCLGDRSCSIPCRASYFALGPIEK